jgi:hypothetical protein
MDRTVPTSGNDEIALYTRTYFSLLRSSREVRLKTLAEAHMHMQSALHAHAASPAFDIDAFTYAVLRLPANFTMAVRHVVMGQSQRVFAENGIADVETWRRVHAPARRRRWFFDGDKTLAVYIASRSDIDDLIPILVAYQIERDKLREALRQPALAAWLADAPDEPLTERDVATLAEMSAISAESWLRLGALWGAACVAHLRDIGQRKVSLTVRNLAASLADYRRATRQWWAHVDETLGDFLFADRPIYFVSSNTHSLSNILSGYALLQRRELVRYIEDQGSAELQLEYHDILDDNVPSSRENFLYYVQKKAESALPDYRRARLAHEARVGIHRVPSQHVFDVELQMFEVGKLDPSCLDPRLCFDGIERLAQSDALIINIDYPLGMAAYQLLSEITRNIAAIRGIYVIGKAATLNGRIGDVMLPSVVHDEHSRNTFLFHNAISADDVAPHLTYGNVLDNQKAITVLGTFLQNRQYMSLFYNEGYTDMEMEAGPYLSCVYELIRPKRYPIDEVVDLHHAPFPIGFAHYASDTPFSKGQNLGAQNLSYYGMDPTYATSLAVLHNILHEEYKLLGKRNRERKPTP